MCRLLPPRNLAAQKHQNFGAISHNFATWSRISPERNKISSLGKRRCKLRTLPHGQLNSVYFGPQVAKNRTVVLTHLTGGHHAVHATRLVFFRSYSTKLGEPKVKSEDPLITCARWLISDCFTCSYLTKDQWRSKSSVEMYIKAFKRGCKCVERKSVSTA